MNFDVLVNRKNADVTITEKPSPRAGLSLYDISVVYPEPTKADLVQIRFSIPCVDIYSVFAPAQMFECTLHPNWRPKGNCSAINGGSPVMAFLSSDGRNRLTLAQSDTLNPVTLFAGVNEFTKCIDIDIKFFDYMPDIIKDYHATLYIDTADRRYDEAIADVARFWENNCGLTPAYIPDVSRRPLYSAWYSFHQQIDTDKIVRECALAKTYGMESIIVDDGWQCDDSNGGYKYCGDWEVAESKVPDMADFVRRVHETGLKFILWYNFAGVGVYSKAHERFKDMLLNPQDESCAELDPRFPAVREYLIDKYRSAILDWDLDGFKLDFVDAVYPREGTMDFDDRMDCYDVEEALDRLLTDICAMAKAIKPDFIIEFRQMFFGPRMRKFANMFRVGDCPNDSLYNRVAGTNMRLILGSSPVHSDMLMWHNSDTVESAAYQVISCLFLVPQISVMLAEIPEEHRKMLSFYLGFWNAHRDTILDGKLEADNPESMFSLIRSTLGEETVAVAYSKNLLEHKAGRADYIVNATTDSALFIKSDAKFEYVVYDCMGNKVSTGSADAPLTEIAVPRCGIIEIK